MNKDNIRDIESSKIKKQDNKLNRVKERYSIHRILYGQNIIVLILFTIIILSLINYLYNQIEQQHTRSTQYIVVNSLSEELKKAKSIALEYSTSRVSVRREEFIVKERKQLDDALKYLQQLEVSYSSSPRRYYAYNGISNGILFLNQELQKMERDNFTDFNVFYSRCYAIIRVLNHLVEYSSGEYLSALVEDNSVIVSQTQNYLRKLRSNLLIFTFIFMLVYILITNRIAKFMINPLKVMIKTADNITHGNLESNDILIDGPEEFVFLEQSMNQMKASLINRMDLMRKNANLQKIVHEEQLQSVKIMNELQSARLSSLQSQINPHFFFNTLNTIRMTAFMENAEKSVKLISSLAGFFHYTLKHRDTVTIEEEMDFVQKYLDLQEARYSDRLSYKLECGKECCKQNIPPLIIQPLVENAIKHGIERKEEGGYVVLNINKIGKRILIEIDDSGIGIDKSLDTILASNSQIHIGIRNIKERLDLYYKGRANLVIRKGVVEGTSAVISIPFEEIANV